MLGHVEIAKFMPETRYPRLRCYRHFPENVSKFCFHLPLPSLKENLGRSPQKRILEDFVKNFYTSRDSRTLVQTFLKRCALFGSRMYANLSKSSVIISPDHDLQVSSSCSRISSQQQQQQQQRYIDLDDSDPIVAANVCFRRSPSYN